MKRITIQNLCVGLFAVFFLANCGGDSAGDGPTLSVSPSMITLDENGNGTLTVSSNTQWTASSADSWLKCSPGSGSGGATVTVTATINNTGDDRTTSLTFTDKSNTKSVSVNVLQKASGSTPEPDSNLNVSTSNLNFTNTGGSQTIDISSNISWTITSSQSWCSVSPTSGSNNKTVPLCYAYH